MTLPLSTTTIAVVETDGDGDPYEDAAVATIATGVRAHFSTPTGRERVAGGQQSAVDMVLLCDIVELTSTHRVIDENTDQAWSVQWVEQRLGLGLDHVEAGVNRVSGASSG